ncbi:MAG: DUF4148 domain-containing protein [Janthinobacterium lividum]
MSKILHIAVAAATLAALSVSSVAMAQSAPISRAGLKAELRDLQAVGYTSVNSVDYPHNLQSAQVAVLQGHSSSQMAADETRISR